MIKNDLLKIKENEKNNSNGIVINHLLIYHSRHFIRAYGYLSLRVGLENNNYNNISHLI